MNNQILTKVPAGKRIKAGKIVGICALVLVSALVLFLLAVFVCNRILWKQEKDYIASCGLLNPVALDDGRAINARYAVAPPPHIPSSCLRGSA